jgi:parallel beta-helix repeat protein
MKMTTNFLIIFLTLFLISCSNEDFDEILPQSNPDTENHAPDPEASENTATEACTFDVSKIEPNQTIIVDCILDLQGKTFDLPSSVTFEFDKGDIINGTLNFPDNGKIDGRLLNSTLTLDGSVKLIDPTFKFYAERWEGIVEGETTSDVALKNNKELERLLEYTKQLGATTFKINKFDAFFEVTKITPPAVHVFRASKEGINIPSDFTLLMTDNTHLRTFPAEAGKENGAIIAINDVDNVKVIGGKLYGDRDQRAYSPRDTGLEGSHLMHIQSGRNVTIDNVSFIEGSKGGLTIYSKGFFTNPANYKPTTNLTIKNCTFKDNRRMGISLTDGREVFIEGNTFINSGQPSSNSDGGEVGYAINVEPARRRAADGTLLEMQKVFNTYIKKNKETNSRGGFLTVTIGQDITVEDNDIGTRVVYSLTNGTKILNNRFKAGGIGLESWAIFAAGSGETVFNNEVAGNEVSGYKTGIVVGSNEAFVHDNVINNSNVGIQLSKPNDTRIIDNKINVVEKGISCTNSFINNGEIRGNKITTTKTNGFHIYFTGVNQTENSKDYKVTIVGNTFLNARKITFSRAKGITFTDNLVDGGLEIGGSADITISANKKIEPASSDGIRLFNVNTNVSILNNTITEPTGQARYTCINNNSDTGSTITNTGNTCN